MRLLLVLGLVGRLLRLFSAAFVPPLVLSLVDGDSRAFTHFAIGAVASFAAGALAARGFSPTPVFQRSEALSVVALTWLSIAVFSAVPLALAGLSLVDAFFEAMSGLTTTGATILLDFSGYGRSFFLWRAMMQWFGGLGVIALFVVVLPSLGIAGRQLFFAEASAAPSEAITTHIRNQAGRLWLLYAGMTALLSALLMTAGMDLYDAVVHALTTVSAGGFSPNGRSIAGYENPAVEWILIPFMLLAGTSYTLQYLAATGRPGSLLRDGEFRFYALQALAVTLLLTWVLADGQMDSSHLRAAAFQATSVISSTGYASTDYNLWPDQARAALLLLMVTGGCAGSAAGGPKAIRLLLVLKRVLREITRVLHPRAVLPIRHGHKPVSDEIVRAVFNLVVLYAALHFLFGVMLVLLGADLVTGMSAAIACLGNIGPGFGPAGPMGSFAGFSDASKLLLSFAMWIGRLEIVTVLALFHRDVWRNMRLRA
ncbi:MAG: TrkH family potassium uptake protein [Myxococcales bacterium]|nr:TrkH family potassium uptake protein [Myxococcales bacterium]